MSIIHEAPDRHHCQPPIYFDGDSVGNVGSIWRCDECGRYSIVRNGLHGRVWCRMGPLSRLRHRSKIRAALNQPEEGEER